MIGLGSDAEFPQAGVSFHLLGVISILYFLGISVSLETPLREKNPIILPLLVL